ncbi:MAG: protein translocase subunit SecD [Candidatus Liptonbacteria bacterium]|nr:protein translocase subunit SecD [Candidatus Liptonbacteria bacterium]
MSEARQKYLLVFIGIVILAVAAGVFVYPTGYGASYKPWKLGLDLVGGSHLIFEVDMSKVESGDRSPVHDGLRDVIERRVNTFGVSEPLVYTAKEGDSYRIIAEIAGIKDSAEAIRQIGRTAFLDFREVVEVGTSTHPETETSGTSSLDVGSVPTPKFEYKETGLTGRFLKTARVDFDQLGKPQIAISFNSEGAALFEEITDKNVGRPLAIFLDEALISAPVVNQKIVGGNAVITGQFTLPETKALAGLLSAGALPAPINLISQQTVNATLGINSLSRAIYAGFIGSLLILLFMVIYYRQFGAFAGLALLIYLTVTLAVFKFVPITMTLAGVAGFILSIGMAVDANILIFERTKEELRRGLSRLSAIEEGFRRAWPSIRDSNITTIISTIILYFYTSSFVRGFALTLFIGVLTSMFSAIIVTRTMLRLFIKNK